MKTLTVDNCLESAICYRDQYNFNDCGKVEKEFPAMVGFYVFYEYDDSCNLNCSKQILLNEKTDSIYSKTIYFKKEGQLFQVLMDPNDPMTYADTTLVNEDIRVKEVINEKGQVESYSIGKLSFPCGIKYEGPNTFQLLYHKNGLIDKVNVYDENYELRVSLKYTYVF